MRKIGIEKWRESKMVKVNRFLKKIWIINIFFLILGMLTIKGEELNVLQGKSFKFTISPKKAAIVGLELDNRKYNLHWSDLEIFSIDLLSKSVAKKFNYKLLHSKEDSYSFLATGETVEITKTYTIEKDYLLKCEFSIKNKSAQKLTLIPRISVKVGGWKGDPDIYPIYIKDKKKEKLKTNTYTGGELEEVGIDTRYVISLLKFVSPWKNLKLVKSSEKEKEKYFFLVEFPETLLDSQEKVTFSFYLFMAPKKDDVLKKYGYPYLIDRGTLGGIILAILRFFYGIFHNWGISIIMMTLLIRVLLYPLNAKQNKSMAEMQKIQPLVEEIKKKYGNDKEKLNQEILKLYREHGINPFGGCLPLLIQLPILFALFNTLRTSIELKGESFLWIKDLSNPSNLAVGGIHIPLLALLIAVSTYIQMKMQSTNNPQQSSMTTIMPVMMFFLSQALPAGVLLYWFVSNLFSILQTYFDVGKLNLQPVTSVAAQNKKKEK